MSFKLALQSFYRKITNLLTTSMVKMSQSVNEKPTARLRPPLIVVLGSTGTGKSKLAIDLALKFNGEVISADSMQVYTGLDILTNKVTKAETKGVPHHMISMVDPLTKFDVKNFRNTALPIVEKLCQEGKLPIVVGGTNYYIESLIWKILIDSKVNESDKKKLEQSKRLKLNDYDETDPKLARTNELLRLFEKRNGEVEYDDLVEWTNTEIHSALKFVDPRRALKLHPNDRRKSLRSLQIFFQTGKTHSDIILEQLQGGNQSSDSDSSSDNNNSSSSSNPSYLQQTNSNTSTDVNNIPLVKSDEAVSSPASRLGGSLRFQNVICLWIQAPIDILEKRIHNRVDEMIVKGLREELNSYMDFIGFETTMVFTEGLLQSIGFKEFEDYLRLSKEEKMSDKGDKIFMNGVTRLKIVTRQYARKQLKWINNRFLRPSRRDVPPVFWLDGSSTDPIDWENNVTSIGEQIVQYHLSNQLDHQLLRERRVPEIVNVIEDDLIARECDVCERILIGNVQWNVHLKSYKHKKTLQKKSKIAQLENNQKVNNNNNNYEEQNQDIDENIKMESSMKT